MAEWVKIYVEQDGPDGVNIVTKTSSHFRAEWSMAGARTLAEMYLSTGIAKTCPCAICIANEELAKLILAAFDASPAHGAEQTEAAAVRH